MTSASYLVWLRANHRADPQFLNYLVNSNAFLSFARKLAIPSVQQSNLNSTRYCRMLIARPPIEEQREIAAHLDSKLAESARLVASIETQITTLTAYRKSLIHECVTGQRRITDADLKHVKANPSLVTEPNDHSTNSKEVASSSPGCEMCPSGPDRATLGLALEKPPSPES